MPLRTLFVDLNSFFASVEQQLDPALRGKPVAVVPVETDSTSCIAASYAAKKFGVRTGTKVGDAKRLCPGLICVKARHTAYIEFHHKVLAAADTVLPVASVHSIDEFSCRLLGEEQRRDRAEDLARRLKRAVAARVGECLTSSIGIAPNRFLAKVASDMHKPDGLVVLDEADLRDRLLSLTLRDLPGIGPKMEHRLHRAGVYTMADLLAADEPRMLALWESVWGSFYYHALRGADLPEKATTRRSIGHQHVLGPDKRNDEDSRAICIRLLDKAAARARHLGYWAKRLTVHVRFTDRRDWSAHEAFNECHDTLTLVEIFARLWNSRPEGIPLRVGVTLDKLRDGLGATRPLFDEGQRKEQLSKAIDAINEKLGRPAVYPASMHRARGSARARIAFRSIPDLSQPHVKESAELDAIDHKPTGSRPQP